LRLVFEKQRQAVAHSNLLVLPSSQMARMIQNCYGHLSGNGSPGFWSKRILVIPWGGWSENVPEDEIAQEAAALREHYRIRPETRVLMTLSRLSPGKGHLLLLKALQLLERRPDRPKDLCLFICGEPAFMRSATYIRQVRTAAERFKSFRVFFPGYLSSRKKQAYFRISELFVSPSVHESYGLSIVEAMRAGLPILASDHSGADEILSPEFSRVVPYNGQAGGWLSFSGRHGNIPHRLADHLADLLADPQKLGAMGRAARHAGENMSFASAAKRLSSAALGLFRDARKSMSSGPLSQV
jgi:glycosyltransferase involved in cell wall biosynthesis